MYTGPLRRTCNEVVRNFRDLSDTGVTDSGRAVSASVEVLVLNQRFVAVGAGMVAIGGCHLKCSKKFAKKNVFVRQSGLFIQIFNERITILGNQNQI